MVANKPETTFEKKSLLKAMGHRQVTFSMRTLLIVAAVVLAAFLLLAAGYVWVFNLIVIMLLVAILFFCWRILYAVRSMSHQVDRIDAIQSQSEHPCPECGLILNREVIFCPNCGNEMVSTK